MKNMLISLFLVLFLSLITVLQTEATTVTYPIAALGNCQSQSACYQYCQNDANKIACSLYASQNGLYKPTGTATISAQFVSDAKSFLGCDGYDSCKAFCQLPANHSQCEAFSKKEGKAKVISTARPPLPDFFAVIKKELGCDSASSCQVVCSNPTNYGRCLSFVITHNFTSLSSTSTQNPTLEYCHEHPSSCPKTASGSAHILPVTSGIHLCTNSSDCLTPHPTATSATASASDK